MKDRPGMSTYLALTFGTLLSSQGTDTSFGPPSSGPSGRFALSCFQLIRGFPARFTGRFPSTRFFVASLGATPELYGARGPTSKSPPPGVEPGGGEVLGSADLGDLRAACERVERGAVALFAALGGGAVGHHLRVLGELQHDRVARRHRRLAPDHDGLAEDLFQDAGHLGLDGGLA